MCDGDAPHSFNWTFVFKSLDFEVIFMVCVNSNQPFADRSLERRRPNCTSPAEKSHWATFCFCTLNNLFLFFFASRMRSESFSHLKAPFPSSNVCWSTLPPGPVRLSRADGSAQAISVRFGPKPLQAEEVGGTNVKESAIHHWRLFRASGRWRRSVNSASFTNRFFFPSGRPAQTELTWWFCADSLCGVAVNLS